MPVIVRKLVPFGDEEILARVIEPSGVISKEDRIRAESLDELLQVRVPEIADEVLDEVPDDPNGVRRWHCLGKKLRVIVDDRRLVLQSDIDNMVVWQAIWQYLPQSMIPKRTNIEKPYSDKQHKRQDHLSLCYEISSYEWDEVSWIQSWAFVHEMTARPSILRDMRIFSALGECIGGLSKNPSLTEFREIMKQLVQAFPTKKYRDSTFLSDDEITYRVSAAIESVTFK